MASINWNSTVNGDWSTGTDWSSGTVPGAGDAVTLGLSGGYAVSITAPITPVDTIAITNSAATLAVQDVSSGLTTGNLSNSGLIYVDNGGSGGSNLTIGGTLTNSRYV